MGINKATDELAGKRGSQGSLPRKGHGQRLPHTLGESDMNEVTAVVRPTTHLMDEGRTLRSVMAAV